MGVIRIKNASMKLNFDCPVSGMHFNFSCTLFYFLSATKKAYNFFDFGFVQETVTLGLPGSETSSILKILSHSSGESLRKSSFERVCSSSNLI